MAKEDLAHNECYMLKKRGQFLGGIFILRIILLVLRVNSFCHTLYIFKHEQK